MTILRPACSLLTQHFCSRFWFRGQGQYEQQIENRQHPTVSNGGSAVKFEILESVWKTTISSYIMRYKSRSCQFYGLLGLIRFFRVAVSPCFITLDTWNWRDITVCMLHTLNSNLCWWWQRVRVAELQNCRIDHRYPCTGESIRLSHSQQVRWSLWSECSLMNWSSDNL